MTSWWIEPLRELVAGRRVLVFGAVAAAWGDHVERFREVGVQEVAVVAPVGRGVGPQPDVPTFAPPPPDGLGQMERLRYEHAFALDPPADATAFVDDFDPEGVALVLGTFLLEAPEVFGRPTVSYRRPEWVALEDKAVVDRFWDDAGIARQPSTVVPLSEAWEAAKRLDTGDGTVWAADARDGFHGGATGTRWVADDQSRDAVVDEFAAKCDTVRVMPFIEGVPCSIHGIVLPDGVAALRPVEMVTLRSGTDLVYAGCATFWDPPDDIRDSMRSTARTVGEHLRRTVDFRGAFTVDGVVAADGFWPTELNPRFGAGIMTITRAAGEVPILLINDLVVAGRDLGRTAREIEDEFVDLADRHRGGGTWIAGRDASVRLDGRDVIRGDHGWAWADEADASVAPEGTPIEPVGTVVAAEFFSRCTWTADGLPTGPSTASSAASFWEFAGDELGLGLPRLTPAVDPFG